MIRAIKNGWSATAAFILSLAVSRLAFAATQSSPITLTDPLGGSESFTTVTTAVSTFLFTDIAIPLSVIMVLVGAFQMMTSAGDPEKFLHGRKTITYAAVGFGVALVATGITQLIKSILTGSSS